MNISPEEEPNMVTIQKVICFLSDCWETMEFVFWTKQDAYCKVEEELRWEIKESNIIISDCTSVFFQLIFTPRWSELPPQSFDYTLYRRKKSSFPFLQAVCTILFILFYFSSVFSSPLFSSFTTSRWLASLCFFSAGNAQKKRIAKIFVVLMSKYNFWDLKKKNIGIIRLSVS